MRVILVRFLLLLLLRISVTGEIGFILLFLFALCYNGRGGGGHPSLEGWLTLWANEQEIRQHPILFDTNTDKMAAAFKDFYGKFL